MTSSRAVETFSRRHRYHALEALPWLAAMAAYFVFPDYLALGAQILATILFALSADLVLGYAGIVTLGHAALFGTGAYAAGILAANGWGEPITGLLAGAAAAALLGFLSGLVVLRTTGLALLMQTLVVATMVAEAANKASFITGGDDGLQGMEVWPIFDRFRFDLFGHTAYFYCLTVLFLCWFAVRHIVHSPFGRSLTGIRENVRRMHAIGAPVVHRRLVIYDVDDALIRVRHTVRSSLRATSHPTLSGAQYASGRIASATVPVRRMCSHDGPRCSMRKKCSRLPIADMPTSVAWLDASSCVASSTPATSAKVTVGLSIVAIRARLLPKESTSLFPLWLRRSMNSMNAPNAISGRMESSAGAQLLISDGCWTTMLTWLSCSDVTP